MPPPPFQLFGTPHIVAMMAMLAVTIVLSAAVRRLDSERATRVVCVVFAAVLLVFFQYFISHAGIVAAALFATWGLGMRPTFKSLIRAFVAMNVMAAVVRGVVGSVGAGLLCGAILAGASGAEVARWHEHGCTNGLTWDLIVK